MNHFIPLFFICGILSSIFTLHAVPLTAAEQNVPASSVPAASSPPIAHTDSLSPVSDTERLSLMPEENSSWKDSWNFKKNVKLERNSELDLLSVEIDPSEFDFGWFQRKIPNGDLSQFCGIYGRFRVPPGNFGKKLHAMMVLATSGKPSEYYTQEIGRCADSAGNWVEFFLPFSQFTPSRNASARAFGTHLLKPGDALEISISVGTTPMKIEFDSLRFVLKEEEATLGRRVARMRFMRLLKPGSEIGGNVHPRLLLHGKRLERIRAKASEGGIQQAGFERLMELAEDAMKKIDAEAPLKRAFAYELNPEMTPHQNRGRFEGTLNPLVIPLETLAAAAVISGNERYGKHAARALVNMARTLDVHSPEISQGFYYTRTFYVRTLAFGYDWLYHWLTPEERMEVKATLLGFIDDIYTRSWEGSWGRHPLDRVWNWDPGLVSCAGLGILAMEGETLAAEEAMLFQFRRHLRDYLTLGIDFDGCCHEGPAYLSYGIGAGPHFAECLRDRGLGDLFVETNWKLTPIWLTAELLPNRRQWNNLSDCGSGQAAGSPVYAYTCGRLAELAKTDPVRRGEKLEIPKETFSGLSYLAHFQETPGPRHLSMGALAELMGWCWNHGSGARAPENFGDAAALAFVLFYEECPIAEDPGIYLPKLQFFRGRGLVVARDGGYGKNALHLAVEAGPHAAGHDQSDKGTFTLRAFGADMVIDSGYGNDGNPNASGSSFAHNVVLIDGQGQPMNWHNSSDGEITGIRHSETFDWIRTSALNAWNFRYAAKQRIPTGQEVEKADRHYILVRSTDDGIPPYVVTFDDFRKKDGSEHEFTWQWHIPPENRFQIGETSWTSVPTGGSYRVLTTRPDKCRGKAVFEHTAPETGRFQIAGFTRCAGADPGKSDSFWVKLNGGPRSCWDLVNSLNFTWSLLKDREAGTPHTLYLTKGEKVRCEISAREPEAQLAFLALTPADEGLPPFPDDETSIPEDGSILGAFSAVRSVGTSEDPFLLETVTRQASNAVLTVFPVCTPAGNTSTEWFTTSKEGVHPKLLHSVQAVEPKFLMVLIPRQDDYAALPTVKALHTAPEQIGTEIQWPCGRVDRIVFRPGENGMIPEFQRETSPK